MRPPALLDFLSGALALAYLVAGVYFLRCWRKVRDRLFLGFAAAFWLLALNQTLVAMLGPEDELTGYLYLLRVIGFGCIIFAIVQKNLGRRRT